MNSWTIIYWAWWMAWCPFVWTFLARISRGRTIRQFVLCVLVVPTVVSSVWFAILGGTAIVLLPLQRRLRVDVLGMFSTKGSLEPHRYIVVLWGSMIAVTAIALLLAGGLSAVQSASIAIGLPFLFVLIAVCVQLLSPLRLQAFRGSAS